ncbi:MAG: hypothetical protein E3J23_06830 [Candidatus Stahlbacteria bacterium]|nr:MAG: hypothetical protein E3J23_06830 [Candidatus Stahlbacteria bacterium]
MLIVSILLFQIIHSTEIIHPKDVRIGMEGFGLSTFQGSKIDTFEVKITGKLPPSTTGEEIIIAELKGDVIDEAGILSGMSGSPVYINGKLLGAVAFGWTFSKKPICGITSFMDMKRGGASSNFGSQGITPIKPVLNASGFHPSSFSLLDSIPGNFIISSGQTGGVTMELTPFVPGGVCGVSLVTGDGNISLMGTITEVRGDTIYAFGHPAFGTGSSSLPLCEGGVSGYLPSLYRSFKFLNPGDIVGTILFDGNSGVKGLLKREPPMVDCKININNIKREYKITKMKNLLPQLSAFLLFSNWMEEIGVYNPVTIKGSFLLYTNQGIVALHPVLSGNRLQYDLYGRLLESLLFIQDNWYEGVSIDSIKMDMVALDEIRKYRIKKLKLKKKEFKVGEEVILSVIIDRYRRPDTTITYNFNVPDEPCKLMIRVSGRDEFIEFERERFPLQFRFDSFSEWKNFVNSLPSRDRVVFSLYKKGAVIGTEEGELKDIPISLHSVLSRDSDSQFIDFFSIYKEDNILLGPVRGEATEIIEVRR